MKNVGGTLYFVTGISETHWVCAMGLTVPNSAVGCRRWRSLPTVAVRGRLTETSLQLGCNL